MTQKSWESESSQDAYLLANTPRSLLKKLRSDPSVQKLSIDLDMNDLKIGLEKALRKTPKSIADHVRPIAYLVAISLKGDRSGMLALDGLSRPEFRWFNDAISILADERMNTSAVTWAAGGASMSIVSSNDNKVAQKVSVTWN